MVRATKEEAVRGGTSNDRWCRSERQANSGSFRKKWSEEDMYRGSVKWAMEIRGSPCPKAASLKLL
jgi:hypothetical protein